MIFRTFIGILALGIGLNAYSQTNLPRVGAYISDGTVYLSAGEATTVSVMTYDKGTDPFLGSIEISLVDLPAGVSVKGSNSCSTRPGSGSCSFILESSASPNTVRIDFGTSYKANIRWTFDWNGKTYSEKSAFTLNYGGNSIVKQFGTNKDDEALGITIDEDGNIFVAGYTYGTFPGQTNVGYKDAYIVKYDTNGNQKWLKQFGTNKNDYIVGITTDKNGNVFVTGYTYGAFPGQTNAGYGDAYIAKYDTNGNQKLVRQFGTNNDDEAISITTDKNGNIFVTGYTWGTFPGQTNTGLGDPFLIKTRLTQ